MPCFGCVETPTGCGNPGLLSASTTSVFVSVVWLWEIVANCRIGKLQVDIEAIIVGLLTQDQNAPRYAVLNGRIVAIYVVRNPEKLTAIQTHPD